MGRGSCTAAGPAKTNVPLRRASAHHEIAGHRQRWQFRYHHSHESFCLDRNLLTSRELRRAYWFDDCIGGDCNISEFVAGTNR
jgi:hypothetical protein